jgi:hypothetical protein
MNDDLERKWETAISALRLRKRRIKFVILFSLFFLFVFLFLVYTLEGVAIFFHQ